MELGIERELASQFCILIFYKIPDAKNNPVFLQHLNLFTSTQKNVGNLLPSFAKEWLRKVRSAPVARELMIR
jgi:hypothetical protein